MANSFDYLEVVTPLDAVELPDTPQNPKAQAARATADDPKNIAAQWWNKISIAQKRVTDARKAWVAAAEMLSAIEIRLKESEAEMYLSGELADKTKYRNAEERDAAVTMAMKPMRASVAKAASDERAKRAALESARDEFDAIRWTLPLIAQSMAR